MNLSYSSVSEIAECIKKYVDIAKLRYPSYCGMTPTLSLKLKGTTAGKASLLENKVIINPELYIRNKEDFHFDTIPHEVAHLVAWQVFRDRGHGEGWKRVMRSFGLTPERCHNYDVSETKQNYTKRRFVYKCGCREHRLSTQRHNKLQRNSGAFVCSICRGGLNFTGLYTERN